MASFRTIFLGFPRWKIDISTAVSGTLSVSLPDVDEYDIPIIIEKPLDMKSLDTTGPPVRAEPQPSPKEMQVKYTTMGIKVRDYAYAGRVISPVVPSTAISANSMKAYSYAEAGIDPTTRNPIPGGEVVHPTPATPEIFDPYWAMAVYMLIIHERTTERERALGNKKAKSLSSLTLPIKACDVPIPGKILHRLMGVAKWLTVEDMNNWLPIDWHSLKTYLDSGAEAAQPFIMRRMPERQLPSWTEQRASISRDLERAWNKSPPSPRTQAAYTKFLTAIDLDPRPPPPTRGGNWVHADGRMYSPSECVRIIAETEFGSTSQLVEPSPRSVYLEGITGEYADGVGDSIPTEADRVAIFQSRGGTARAFWNCLRRTWVTKRGIAVPSKENEKMGKVERLVEQKPAPNMKRGLEDGSIQENSGRRKRFRLFI